MPSYKGHILSGATLCLLIMFLLNKIELLFFEIKLISTLLFIGIFYSILPDLDIRSSKARQVVDFLGLLFAMFMIFKGNYFIAICILIVMLLMFFTRHRGFIHTIRACLIFSLPLLFLGEIEFIMGFSAYLIHLLLDNHLKF